MPVLGYTVENTKLVVDEIEAASVRQIFELYLEHHRSCCSFTFWVSI
jgi:site-specific DNA recombinase